jgi:hypothetical protein
MRPIRMGMMLAANRLPAYPIATARFAERQLLLEFSPVSVRELLPTPES